MKRIDKIKQMTAEELGDTLCGLMANLDPNLVEFPCHVCPFTNLCYSGDNGALAWLNQEVEDDK